MFFMLFARGDVGGRPKPFDNGAFFVHERNGSGEGPACRSVSTEDGMFKLERSLRSYGLVDGLQNARLIVGMDILLQPATAWFERIGNKLLSVQIAHDAPVRAHAINHIKARRHVCT